MGHLVSKKSKMFWQTQTVGTLSWTLELHFTTHQEFKETKLRTIKHTLNFRTANGEVTYNEVVDVYFEQLGLRGYLKIRLRYLPWVSSVATAVLV